MRVPDYDYNMSGKIITAENSPADPSYESNQNFDYVEPSNSKT